MHRFLRNRFWTLLLALCIGVLGVTAMSNSAYSDTGSGGWSGDDTGDIHPPDAPPPTGSGDPDSPANGGKPAARPSVNGGRVGVFGSHGGSGVATTQQAALLWKMRLMVHALKVYSLRW